MTKSEQKAEPVEDLVVAISACIVKADAAGLFLVAAHLDTALSTLVGVELPPRNDGEGRPLH